MAKAPKLGYTGTFIPAHIMEDKELSAATKITYGIIASFKESCFASNTWLAKMVGVSVRTIQNSINTLVDRELIARAGEDDNERVLIALYDDPRKNFMGGMQNLHGGHEKISPNSKEESKEESPTDSSAAGAAPSDSSLTKDEPQDTPPGVGRYEKPTVHALHYRVIKKYGLPVSNHLHVSAKSKAFIQEIGEDAALAYLQRLLDVSYREIQGEFKPELNHSRDVYDKRIQITKFLDEHTPKQTPTPGKSALDQAQDRYKNKDWGF